MLLLPGGCERPGDLLLRTARPVGSLTAVVSTPFGAKVQRLGKMNGFTDLRGLRKACTAGKGWRRQQFCRLSRSQHGRRGITMAGTRTVIY